jgi:nucleoside-diphosphate-sugar epimerase
MRRDISVLVVGYGDVGSRIAAMLKCQYRVTALVRKRSHVHTARRAGVRFLEGDLDHPHRLRILRAPGTPHFDWIFHCVPPRNSGRRDWRTARLLDALAAAGRGPRTRLVYVSTTGVYGNCNGAWVDESSPLRAQTARARRRVSAERMVRDWGRRQGAGVAILRAPGIVSATRLPLERLRRGIAVLHGDEDVFVNHIHAHDLARAAILAARHARHGRVFNVSDGEPILMGDYFDAVADAFRLPRPPRITRAHAGQALSPLRLSFMNESRKIVNARMTRELRMRLSHPGVRAWLRALAAAQAANECGPATAPRRGDTPRR